MHAPFPADPALYHDQLHECPHPACTQRLPRLIWACAEHWQVLPPTIRQGIWIASRDADHESPALEVATARAHAFWDEAMVGTSAPASTVPLRDVAA